MEQWRAIRGHPGYQVSNEGRVRSVDRWIHYCDGRRAKFKGKLLKPGAVGKGYLQVALGGDAPNNYVHDLVGRAFIGMPRRRQEIRHLDGNPANNRATNLCWGTKSENQLDRIVHGTHARGERNPMAKFTAEAVREIRSREISIPVLLKKYDISRSYLHALRNRECWGWLP